MKAKAVILFGAVFLIFFQCFGDNGSDVAKAFGGSAYLATVANADSVNAWRTIGSLEQETRQGFKMADIYSRAGKPTPVSKSLGAPLAKQLQDRHSYIRPGTALKGCIPVPEVLIAFTRGNQEVDAYFCFECNVLVVGQVQSDFDPGRPAILKLVKQIFPNDSFIQSLK
jgi:hypothetical protein